MNTSIVQIKLNIIFTLILGDQLKAILEAKATDAKSKRSKGMRKRGREGWGISSEKGVSHHNCCFPDLHLETLV